MRRITLLIPLVTALFTGANLAALQGESIFVKAIAGGGYTMVNETAGDVKLSFTGISAISYLQAGGSLSKSVKLFGFSGISMAPKPTAKTENLKIDTVYDYQTIFDLGLGMGFYSKTGWNLSLGMSIAQSYYKFNVYGVDIGTYTRHGWGSNLMLGKEFSLSPHWSFGVSLIAYYGRVYDVGTPPFQDAPVTNMYGGLAVSLMYD